MLIKEYRIPLPMTVEEYKIAQLYMIAKKSREETKVRKSSLEPFINYADKQRGEGVSQKSTILNTYRVFTRRVHNFVTNLCYKSVYFSYKHPVI